MFILQIEAEGILQALKTKDVLWANGDALVCPVFYKIFKVNGLNEAV